MRIFGKPGEVTACPTGSDFFTIGLPAFTSKGTYNWGTVDAQGRVIAAKNITTDLRGPSGKDGIAGSQGMIGPIGPIGPTGGSTTYLAGETIGSPRAVMLVGGQLFLFDPAVEDNVHKLVGVSNTSGTAGSSISVVLYGSLDSAGSFVQDTVYYAGASGVLTGTVPLSGIVVKMGIAQTTGRIIVEMSEPLIMA